MIISSNDNGVTFDPVLKLTTNGTIEETVEWFGWWDDPPRREIFGYKLKEKVQPKE